MNRFTIIFLLALLMTGEDTSAQGNQNAQRILIFSKTKGFYHKSIPTAVAALQKLATENKIAADTTKDASRFTEANLKQYKAVVFLSTTGDVLDDEQQRAFMAYIRSGGGFVGIHAAADTEYDWPWYNELVGAYFLSHPKVQEAVVVTNDKKHIATRMLPDQWKRTDEWYNYKSIQPGINVLCTLDEASYEGGKNGANHPIAWYRAFDGGRMFYTGGGHTDESFAEPLFLAHILGGIHYAMGSKKAK